MMKSPMPARSITSATLKTHGKTSLVELPGHAHPFGSDQPGSMCRKSRTAP